MLADHEKRGIVTVLLSVDTRPVSESIDMGYSSGIILSMRARAG